MSNLAHRLAALCVSAAVIITIGSAWADDYTFLKYLDGVNDTYFNTGIVVTDQMEFRFRYAMLNCTLYHGPFSTYAGETANATRIICANGSTTTVGVNFMTKASGGTVKFYDITAKAGDVVEGYMNYNEARLNTNLQLIDRSAGKEGTADNSTLDLFGRKDWYSDKMRIYNFRVYIGGTLNRFYAMARRTVDNALGLYDLVNKQFYQKSGGGDFAAAGPAEEGLRLAEDIYQYRVLATAEGGMVSVNGGAASSSAEVWTNVGEDRAVTLTATPALGYRFDHWEGDVEALTAAERKSPTLTRTLSAPFGVKAVCILDPETVFVVAATPKEFNTDPATVEYGPVAVEAGDTLTAPASISFSRGTHYCRGYLLYRYADGAYDKVGASEDLSYTVTAETTVGYQLVWQWETEYETEGALGPDDYVQDGLIAQFDVLCEKDDNVWRDRMGNCTWAISGDGFSFENGESEDDLGWAVVTKTRIGTICSRLPNVYAPTTIEAFAYASTPGYNSSADSVFGCGQNISLWWQGDASKFGACAPILDGVGYYGGNNGPFSVTPFSPDSLNTWTVQSDGAYGYKVYLNGTNGVFQIATSFWTEHTPLSKSVYLGHPQMTLKARSLRLYSRQLSAEEVAFNAAVDNIRFRGGMFPDDLPGTLPEGVRLNAAQDGLNVRVIAKVEDESGLISMNGEEAAVSNECWVASGTEIVLDFVGNPGMSVGEWKGVPSVMTTPTRTSIAFKAHGALSIVATGKSYSEVPIMELSKVSSASATFSYNYNVSNAGGESETVTLRTIYGQNANSLCYTNDVSGVIGEGGVTISGLIHSRTYFFKVVAFNDEGAETESDLMSIETTTPSNATIYDGKYGEYDSRQPLVRGLYGMGLQESLRLRGPITAPTGTRLIVHYGLADDIEKMASVDFGTECIADGKYSVVVEKVPVGACYVILETIAGEFVDYFHVPATDGTWKTPSFSVVAKEDLPGMHPAAIFTGANYLQVREALPGDTFKNDFTMSVWVKNPRGLSDGGPGENDLRRIGYIIGCGTDARGAVGPMLAMRPYNWTHDTDEEWKKNPQWSLCATYRDLNDIDWVAKIDPTPECDISRDDEWHNIVMTCSATEKRVSLYLDRELVASVQDNSMKNHESGNKLTFAGRYHSPESSGHMIGMMADATIWKKVLSKKEIRRLSFRKVKDDDPALVGHWLGKVAPFLQDSCLNNFYPNDISFGSAQFERDTHLYIPSVGLSIHVR